MSEKQKKLSDENGASNETCDWSISDSIVDWSIFITWSHLMASNLRILFLISKLA